MFRKRAGGDVEVGKESSLTTDDTDEEEEDEEGEEADGRGFSTGSLLAGV